jgi:putative copper resistance protein D
MRWCCTDAAPSATVEVSDGLAFPAVRGLILLTLMLLVGTAASGLLVLRHGPSTDRPEGAVIDGWLRRFPSLAAWFLLVLSMARGALQVLSFTFEGEPIDTELATAVLGTGSWGTGWIVQSCGAFALLALSWLLRHDLRRLLWTVAGFALLLILAQSGMGHGADPHWQPSGLGRVIHIAHLIGAGVWLGTLAILALMVFPSLQEPPLLPTLTAIVTDYSRLARAGVLIVVTSGGLAVWHYSTRILALPETTWGVLLLLKLTMVGAAGMVGLWNWRRITPQLAGGDPASAAGLRRMVLLELGIGLVIVGLTAYLGATALPIDLAA